jgi:hypothetical protein
MLVAGHENMSSAASFARSSTSFCLIDSYIFQTFPTRHIFPFGSKYIVFLLAGKNVNTMRDSQDSYDDPFHDTYKIVLPEHPNPLGSHPPERFYTPPESMHADYSGMASSENAIGYNLPQDAKDTISGLDGNRKQRRWIGL